MADRQPASRASVRREQIVDAAIDLFGQRGFRGTSVAAVAQHVGVTDAGVLYHFRTKDDLLVAVVERLSHAHWDAMQAGLSAGGLGSIRALGAWGAWMEANREYQALMVVLSAEHLNDDSVVNRYFTKRYGALLSGITEAFRRAVADGDLRAGTDPQLEASQFVALLDGIRLQWFLLGEAVSMAEAVERYIDATITRLTDPEA
ncbi:MAG TPA: TetR/AcrR family transcriptional regulator [Acidimicrobiales bacterium]|jgi:AcrR family transcriptional regulator|nr:TetR/AcrR family transcriptional regulator [Acidimicrobiales bacterium]